MTDALKRRDLIDATRRALPDIDAVAGLKAVRTLAALRNDPYYRQAVEAHLTQASTGFDRRSFSKLPDTFKAREHATRVKRSRKGRTTNEVVKHGMARVIGDRYEPVNGHAWGVPAADDSAMGTHTRASADLVALAPYKLHGADSLMVQRITDKHYAAHGLDALIGTDVEAWATVVPGDVSSRCSVAVQRSDLFGGLLPTHLARFAQQRAVYTDDTQVGHGKPRTARFALSRNRLRIVKARKTDPATVTRKVVKDGKARSVSRFVPQIDYVLATPTTYNLSAAGYGRCILKRVRYVMPNDRLAVRWTTDDGRDHLNTIPPESVWIGHQLAPRGMTDLQQRAVATQANDARTIGTVDAPTTESGWATLADGLNRGERVKVQYADGPTRTISRADSGDYATTLPDGERIKARSAEALALRLA